MSEKFFSRQANHLLCYVIRANEFVPGFRFFSSPEDGIQVGCWSKVRGEKSVPHIHKKVPRCSDYTQEAVLVIRGSFLVSVFDLDFKYLNEITLNTGDLLVSLRGGHSYEGRDSESVVLEFKNGPYVGAEQDRLQF